MLGLCGAGLLDATRIAAGDSALWTDILRANALEVADALSELTAELDAAARALRSGCDELPALLERGNRGRIALVSALPGR
ncbi:prephenate dehydrogenase dimerization domain-containing protein [Nocardia sp. NPDC101769]|uniref:prephenate dehydrogenase dimerization domain-containing protein n=1 Tax=Nocardia sp. NPDC101769 TaxID=3364333 RepID=UPI0037FF14C5